MRAVLYLLIGILGGATVAWGQSVPRVPDALAESELYRLVKRFDFNERAEGNYEDLPMNWFRLEGDGLPFYSAGKFDDDTGYGAAPAFRLSVQTGNVAYEYRHFDLTVVPQSDYMVEGYIRTENLVHSRAFIATYLVDRFQERIPGSELISNLVGGTSSWQRVAVEVPGDHPDAYALRVQVWILKTHVWRESNPNEIDPIVRQDTHGHAWFDDIIVYRLPRARLRFSNPAGLVQPGARESLLIEVNNATPQQLLGEVELHRVNGEMVHRRPLVVPGTVILGAEEAAEAEAGEALVLAASRWDELRQLRVPLPQLPPGVYQAVLRLRSEADPLLVRRFQFAVLPRLEISPQAHPDLGVDLGAWRSGPIDGALEAVRSLGVGAIQVGVPFIGPLNTQEKQDYYTHISELIRRSAELRIESVGVMLSQTAGLNLLTGQATVEQLDQPRDWEAMASPILAHFGGLINTWQLGTEMLELRVDSTWNEEKIARVVDQVRQFNTLPSLALPRRAGDPDAPQSMIVSRWIAPEVPTRAMPQMLGSLLETRDRAHWVRLDWPLGGGVTDGEIADRARRFLLAKALHPDRLHVPAPLTLTNTGGIPAWQPTEDFLWLRTLAHYLAGKRAIAASKPSEGVTALLFDSPTSSSCLAIWSWRHGVTEPVEMYLGPNARAFDLLGQPVPLERVEDRMRIPVGPVPILIESLQTPLVVLHSSYSVRPRQVQAHDPQPAPLLRFKNPYDTVMSGEIELTPPDNWSLSPTRVAFTLAPGEWLEQPLEFTLPPRQLARGYPLEIAVRVREPHMRRLDFKPNMEVGLVGIELQASAYWESGKLIVEQTLRNDGEEPVSFNSFCWPPERGRYEGAFIDVPPGVTMTTTYVFPDAEGLAGSVLHHGIEEIAGPRRLDKVVEVPN